MGKRFAIGPLLALTALLLLGVGTADAHVLSKSRAHDASENGIKRQCQADPSCQDYGLDRCSRPAGSGHRQLHRVRCSVFLSGTDEVGPWKCTWVDQWSIKDGSRHLNWSQSVYNSTVDCEHLKIRA